MTVNGKTKIREAVKKRSGKSGQQEKSPEKTDPPTATCPF
jgi:hypothetical protein